MYLFEALTYNKNSDKVKNGTAQDKVTEGRKHYS